MIELPTITHHNISTVLYTSIRITRDSKLQCAQSHITILQCPISGLFLPRVMPLGHLMLSVTKATRSAPFSPLFSILASSPQSVQYMKLETDTVPSVKTPTSNTLQHNIWRSLEKITHTHTHGHVELLPCFLLRKRSSLIQLFQYVRQQKNPVEDLSFWFSWQSTPY